MATADTELDPDFRAVVIDRFEDLFEESAEQRQDDFIAHLNQSADDRIAQITKPTYYNFVRHLRPVSRYTAMRLLRALGFKPDEAERMLIRTHDRETKQIANFTTASKLPLILGHAVQEPITLEAAADGERNDTRGTQPSPQPLAPRLPVPVTALIGRDIEIAQVTRLLEQHRLVTLVGAGGVGKTRVAIAVASEVVPGVQDGVWFVELAPLAVLASPDVIATSVCKALKVPELTGKSSNEALEEFLSSRSSLLILDNCEHLAEACARFVKSLLLRCEHVRVLATSRAPLGIFGEKTFKVPPLAFPPSTMTQEYMERNGGAALCLMAYSSVRMFVMRTETHLVANSLTMEQWLAIAEICRQLDGIPLAIEMAAARAPAITVLDICLRLSDRFNLLRSAGTSLPRHQTLKHVVDWSFALLNEHEQTLFRRLSVFAGGWTMEAAEAVATDQDIPRSDVLHLLSSLVGKSLVERAPTQEYTRYRFLETIRVYAMDRLSESPDHGFMLQVSHRDYFLAVAQQANTESDGRDQARLLSELDRDRDNLEKALTFCKTHPEEAMAGLRLAAILQPLWLTRGYVVKGRRWLTELLSLSQTKYPTDVRAAALNSLGTLAMQQGDAAIAQVSFEESLDMYRNLEDKRGEAMCLGHLAEACFDQGMYARARSLMEEGLYVYRALNDDRNMARCFRELGVMAYRQRDLATARRYLEQAVDILRELAIEADVNFCLYIFGMISLREGDLGGAISILERVLVFDHAQEDTTKVSRNLNAMAELYIRKHLLESADLKYFEIAITLLGTVERLNEELGISSALSPEADSDLCLAQSTLGEQAFNALKQRGRTMTLDQAVALAMGWANDFASAT